MSEQCQNPGTHKFTWPGKYESYICDIHLPKLRMVANAMGVYIQIRPLPEDEQWQCQQISDARQSALRQGEGGGE